MIHTEKLTVSSIIAAAGCGSRMNSETPKQFMKIGSVPVLARTLRVFQECPDIDEIIIVTRESDIGKVTELAYMYGITKVRSVTAGGKTRQESVRNGLLRAGGDLVLIHDGARPFVTAEQISAIVTALHKSDAAALGVAVSDTLKRADEGNIITETVNRNNIFSIQTPQGFRAELIRHAHDYADQNNISGTDDCALCEELGVKVQILRGSPLNIKITNPEDIVLANGILAATEAKEMRIGHGYDVHKLVENRPLILGGTEISYEYGLLGHSDADVLLHAIMDALLGAAALGDIGRHFPDTSDEWLGADSIKLLGAVGRLLSENGAEIVNIDSTIIAQAPKLAEYIPVMRERIATALHISLNRVSVKATTTEHLGFCGRGEGIAAEATCCIKASE